MSTFTPSTSTPATPALPPTVLPATWSLADLQEHLGHIPPNRIRLYPPPGLATVEDALLLGDRGEAICELVDGVLVEKPMGTFESVLAMVLGYYLMDHLNHDNQGIVAGEKGSLQILPTRMRVPDVSFIRWDSFPERKLPKDRVYRMAPDLAVEIISAGNTKQEMENKLDEYFQAGVKLVWYIYPDSKTARIYTARDQMSEVNQQGMLDGGQVLTGFQLRLGDLFERAEQPPK
jgi:Uma2 family endonuclease